MIDLEPAWKSYVVTTSKPLFTPEQCDEIIRLGQRQPPEVAKIGTSGKYEEDPTKLYDASTVNKDKRITTISWIPFNSPLTQPMYNIVDAWLKNINVNHFGFEGVKITEQAQYTEYQVNSHYDWHTDSDLFMTKQPPVRKISMSCLLSKEDEFEGGDFQVQDHTNKPIHLKQGHAVFFASFVRHRVTPVTKGNRKSLVMWFGGPPLK